MESRNNTPDTAKREPLNADEEFKLDCLARWILALPKDERQPWFSRFRKRHGDTMADDIRRRMTKECSK